MIKRMRDLPAAVTGAIFFIFDIGAIVYVMIKTIIEGSILPGDYTIYSLILCVPSCVLFGIVFFTSVITITVTKTSIKTTLFGYLLKEFFIDTIVSISAVTTPVSGFRKVTFFKETIPASTLSKSERREFKKKNEIIFILKKDDITAISELIDKPILC